MTNSPTNFNASFNRKVLFIGNGINNLNNKESWESLVQKLRDKVGKEVESDDLKSVFPLVFENILNFGILNNTISDEDELKKIVGDNVDKIQRNGIHDRIDSINPEHIITSNYDFVLEGNINVSRKDTINERKYSIYRCYIAKGRHFWHVHGDSRNPQSINLGYEHYSGQLQYLRNYVVSGTNYKSDKVPSKPLTSRLKADKVRIDSWVDLFFVRDVHIVGLAMDFIEIDLWWLLTFRAKLLNQKKYNFNNKLYYYIPSMCVPNASGKLELLRNLGVQTIKIDAIDYNYYDEVLNRFENY